MKEKITHIWQQAFELSQQIFVENGNAGSPDSTPTYCTRTRCGAYYRLHNASV